MICNAGEGVFYRFNIDTARYAQVASCGSVPSLQALPRQYRNASKKNDRISVDGLLTLHIINPRPSKHEHAKPLSQFDRLRDSDLDRAYQVPNLAGDRFAKSLSEFSPVVL